MRPKIDLVQNFVDFFLLEPLLFPLGRGRVAYKILHQAPINHVVE